MIGYILWAGCQYEAHALATGRVPTITRLCWRWRHTYRGLAVIVAAIGWLVYHLLVDDDK